MALHFFKSAGGVGPIADDAGQSGANIFDDVTFDETGGQSRDQGLFVRNADPTKRYENVLITIEDNDPVLAARCFDEGTPRDLQSKITLQFIFVYRIFR